MTEAPLVDAIDVALKDSNGFLSRAGKSFCSPPS